MKNCFVRILYYTCWALAHIVHVVGTSSKQPLVRDCGWMDGYVLVWDWWEIAGKKGPPHKSFRMYKVCWFKFRFNTISFNSVILGDIMFIITVLVHYIICL